MPEEKLTDGQERFCREYLIDLNALQAAIRAGYSKDSAGQQGCRLLKNAKVQAYLAELRDALSRKLEITAEKVLQELAKVAFANMEDYLEFSAAGVSMKNSKELTRDQMAAVVEVSEVTGKNSTTVRFKLHDKHRALEALGKHLGLFTEKVKHEGLPGTPEKPFVIVMGEQPKESE